MGPVSRALAGVDVTLELPDLILCDEDAVAAEAED